MKTVCCSKRFTGDPKLFDSTELEEWEREYQRILEKKYQKTTRRYSTKITGTVLEGKDPPIFMIPRQRGGPSYKDVILEGDLTSEDLQFCPISKGFSMQEISSFTLGPVVSEGLCLVNVAFSKLVCIGHIEGGGKVNLKRKNFWQRSRKPLRKIKVLDDTYMKVDRKKVAICEWLEDNKDEWLGEWLKWSTSIALCSRGDFHWACGDTVTYLHRGRYLSFQEWKKECYIRPSYDLLEKTKVYKFLTELREKGIPLGLVHPMAREHGTLKPMTRKRISEIFESPYEMCCQPYVVAGKLLGVSI